MPEADSVDIRAVGLAATAIAGMVTVVIGSVFATLAFMHEPPGGAPTDAGAIVAPLREAGTATLQTAPQDDLAAWRRRPATTSTAAASEATR